MHLTDEAAYDAIAMQDRGVTREETARTLMETYGGKGITEQDIADNAYGGGSSVTGKETVSNRIRIIIE